MEKINLSENVYADLEREELSDKIESFRVAGFGYFPFDKIFYISARVKLPSGEFIFMHNLDKKLSNLKIGNLKQIEIVKSVEFFQMCQVYY